MVPFAKMAVFEVVGGLNFAVAAVFLEHKRMFTGDMSCTTHRKSFKE